MHNTPMCGRYFLETLPDTMADAFSVKVPNELAASFNIAPTDRSPIVRLDQDGERRFEYARWGLVPFWAKDLKIGARMINARIETVAEKPAYRKAWRSRRCLVPASGFFEWRREGRQRFPSAIVPADRSLLCFGGLWETWRDRESGESVRSFSIVTTDAVGPIADLHDRMPVLLTADQQASWLRAELEPAQLSDGVAEAVTLFPVSQAVNSVRNNYPELLEPLNPPDAPKPS
ncbi:MAG: SOS response-associated peptidase [Pseudomonadota bacterium]